MVTAGSPASWHSARCSGHSKSPQKTFPGSRALLSEQEKDEEGPLGSASFPALAEVAEEAAEGGQAKPRPCTSTRLQGPGTGDHGAKASAVATITVRGQWGRRGLCRPQGRTWLGEAARRWRRENFLSEQRLRERTQKREGREGPGGRGWREKE